MQSSYLHWQRYFSFQGRAPRWEAWWIFLVIGLPCALGTRLIINLFGTPDPVVFLVALLFMTYSWAQLATYARRLHDRGKSAWWILLSLVPVIGPLWFFIEVFCLKGVPGESIYGPPLRPLPPSLGAPVVKEAHWL